MTHPPAATAPRTSWANVLGQPYEALPVPPTPLVGRDDQLLGIRELVESPTARLITLTGAVGVGKTRLALAVADQVWREPPRRVAMIRLADLADISDPWPAVVAQLGLGVPDGADLHGELRAHLADEPTLLLIDGVDHLPGLAVALADLVAECRDLCVLATGVQPLRRAAEQVVQVEPLPLPTLDGDSDHDLERLATEPAVALFLDRAGRQDPSFHLNARNAADVVALCRGLDGLPLSLELAAARLSVLPVHHLARQVAGEGGLDLLGRATADAPARHASLRAALDWSYGLLDDHQQQLYRALSIAEGAFELDLALALCPDREQTEVLDALADLVEARLVTASPTGIDGQPGFVVAGPLRVFGRERLRESGEAPRVRSAHAGWSTSLATRAVDGGDPRGDTNLLQRVDLARSDLRAAVHWLWDRGEVADALEIFLAAAMLRERLGYDPICHALHDDILSTVRTDPTISHARRALAIGWAAHLELLVVDRVPEGSTAPDDLHEAVRLARHTRDPDVRLLTLSLVTRSVRMTLDRAAAEAAAQEGRGLASRTGRAAWAARFEAWCGMLAEHRGDVAAGRRQGRSALAMAQAAEDPRAIVLAGLLCASMSREETVGRALPSADELLACALDVGDRRAAVWVLALASSEATSRGDHATAARQTVQRLRLLGPHRPIGMLGASYMTLARLSAQRGHLRTAARFHGFLVDDMPVVVASIPVRWRQRHEGFVDDLRGRLGVASFDAEVDAGRQTPPEGAFETAMSYARQMVDLADRSGPGQPGSSRTGADPIGGRVASDEAGLAPRQREVLELIAEGLTNKQIGSRLGVSHKTVMNHNVVIFRKLGVSSRAAATAWLLGAEGSATPQPAWASPGP